MTDDTQKLGARSHAVDSPRRALQCAVQVAASVSQGGGHGHGVKDRHDNPPICVVGGVAVWSRKCGRCQVRYGGFEVEGRGVVVTEQQSLFLEGAGDADGDGVEQALEFGLCRVQPRRKRGRSSSNV